VSAVLVLAWGNPSRGDDALGPQLVQRLEALASERPGWHRHALLTDFQLQPEHAMDLASHDLVLFADASLVAATPYAFSRVQPSRDHSFTSHAMSPAAVLAVYRQLFDRDPPDAYMLAIRGERFELGEDPGEAGQRNLEAAVALAVRLLDAEDPVATASRCMSTACGATGEQHGPTDSSLLTAI
jgi:hydrogenase maturation protease